MISRLIDNGSALCELQSLVKNTQPTRLVIAVLTTKMDQTQQKALSALEPYILLSKSANSPRAAADLVTQATSAPNTFVFAELLQTPNIQALQTASSEYSPYLTLLQIFAWGTWSDCTCTPIIFSSRFH